MTPRRTLVWPLAGGAAAVLAAGLFFPTTENTELFLFAALPFLIVGTLVADRRPDNPVGWLFLGFATTASIAATCDRYWGSGPGGAGSRPGADLAASISVHLWHPGFAFFVLAFLLFPEGKLLSRRWSIAAWLTATLGIVGVFSGMLEHDFYKDLITGPVRPHALVTGPVAKIAGAVFAICVIGLVVMLGVSAVCIFVRFARSTSTLRHQMKWVVSAVILFAIALPGSLVLMGQAYGVITLPLIPIAAGIAILRHRLFDIDVIINRALVYGSLTVVLGLVYALGVLGGEALVRRVTGEQGNSLIVAGSTLAVAALFRPVRARVQSVIERRFYRKRYDAAQTLADFSTRLRELVDLESLNAELLGVTTSTMQPSHASLWLKSNGARRNE